MQSPVGNRAFRGVRGKRKQMDVKKENNLAVTPRERTKSNRTEARRSADEEGAGEASPGSRCKKLGDERD